MDHADRRIVRSISLAEFVLGAAIVLGHNIWHVVPNEVPILFLMGVVSTRLLRERSWSALGLGRPASWRNVVLIALVAAAIRVVLGDYVLDPITARFLPPEHVSRTLSGVTAGPSGIVKGLLLVWTFAAIGEEVSYRGYLTKRAADLGAGAPWAWWTATLVVAVLFGLGHFYKGPAGMIDSGMAGLVLGAAYLISGRSLYTTILAHGLIDTVGILIG